MVSIFHSSRSHNIEEHQIRADYLSGHQGAYWFHILLIEVTIVQALVFIFSIPVPTWRLQALHLLQHHTGF